jgi:hypothetical protein
VGDSSCFIWSDTVSTVTPEQDNARVELDHPGNTCQGAAYSLVEHMLARLESTSQLPALRDVNYNPLYQ